MTNYDKAKLQRQISDENGTNYHRNVPLDGFTITYDDSFISFSFKEINGITVVVIAYMYITNKKALLALLGYCINVWNGYGAKMIWYREHKRKSNVVQLLKHLDFIVTSTKKTDWKHKWISTNGYTESDCWEVFTSPNNSKVTKKTRKAKKLKK